MALSIILLACPICLRDISVWATVAFDWKWKPQFSSLDLRLLNFGGKIPSLNLGVTPATRVPHVPSGRGRAAVEWRAALHWKVWKLDMQIAAEKYALLSSFKKCFLVKIQWTQLLWLPAGFWGELLEVLSVVHKCVVFPSSEDSASPCVWILSSNL